MTRRASAGGEKEDGMTDGPDEALDEIFEDDFCQCPRCSGWGWIDCHCGGDLCVCMNYGEATCPLCHGDGEVSEALYQRYEAARRENARLFAEARAKIDAERGKK